MSSYSNEFWAAFDDATKEAEKSEEWICTEKEIDLLLADMSHDDKDKAFELFLKLWTISMNRMFINQQTP